MKRELPGIAVRYSAIGDLVVFMIDADGEDGYKRQKGSSRYFHCIDSSEHEEQVCRRGRNSGDGSVGAVGARTGIKDSWADVRTEIHPKETYFDRLTSEADQRFPGRGRERLIKDSLAGGWTSLKTGCPELDGLEAAIAALL